MTASPTRGARKALYLEVNALPGVWHADYWLALLLCFGMNRLGDGNYYTTASRITAEAFNQFIAARRCLATTAPPLP